MWGLNRLHVNEFFDLLSIVNEKEKGEVSENHIVFEDSFAFGFLCLISLVSSFAKEETRETRRKEKKEERLPRSRLPFDKIPLRPAR